MLSWNIQNDIISCLAEIGDRIKKHVSEPTHYAIIPDGVTESYSNKEVLLICTAQKMKFSIRDFFSKRDQIRRKLYDIWDILTECPEYMKLSLILCILRDDLPIKLVGKPF